MTRSDRALEASGPDGSPTNGWVRTIIRLAVALLIGAGAAELFWRRYPSHLSISTDIVGYPIFADFNPYRYIGLFESFALVFPVVSMVLFLLLSWRGPLRHRTDRSWPPAFANPSLPGVPLEVPGATIGVRPGLGLLSALGRLARIALPAITLSVGLRIAQPGSRSITWSSFGPAAVYFGVVVILAEMWFLWSPYQKASRAKFFDSISLVNSLGALSVIPCLYLVSQSTSVRVISTHRLVHYPWFPLSAAVVGSAIGVAAWLFFGLRTIRSPGKAIRLELVALVLVVVPVLVFFESAVLQGAQGPFNGFDDAQSMVGAQLTFFHGLFPWRDVFLLHGVLFDNFYGAIGIGVFSDTRWGSNAGVSFLVIPCVYVIYTLFAVYFSRKNRLVAVGVSAAMILGLLSFVGSSRFALVPILFILFDQVLARQSRRWCTLFMIAVVLASILTPEVTLLALGMLATLAAFEFVHRQPGASLRRSFFRTIWCFVSGLVATALWVGILASEDSLTGFVNYYRTNASGHELWGAFPIQFIFGFNPFTIEMLIPIFLFAITICRVTIKFVRRSAWTRNDWALVAAATFVPLYYTKQLDRLDGGHVQEVFQAVLPLVLLWTIEILAAADKLLRRSVAKLLPRVHFSWRHPMTLIAVAVVIFESPVAAASLTAAPASFHVSVPSGPPAAAPRLGYTQPDAIPLDQVADLRAVLDRYAGPRAPVFDFTNEMGYTYFVLNRVPGAPFYHVEAAQTDLAQQLEITALEKSRPPVVIFTDTTFGLVDYDGLFSPERNYDVSRYILGHYRPILDTDGQLIMIRNDLSSHAPPPPALSSPPQTSDLYFDMPVCNWGYVPNFLETPTNVEQSSGVGAALIPEGRLQQISVSGWAVDGPTGQAAIAVLAVQEGQIIGLTVPYITRPDVVKILHDTRALLSGFQFSFDVRTGSTYSLFAVNHDGTVSPIPASSKVVESSVKKQQEGVAAVSGSGVPTRPVRLGTLSGNEEHQSRGKAEATWSVQLPAGTNLGSFYWLKLTSSVPFSNASYTLSDSESDALNHEIQFQTLPRSGKALYLRAGSCLQWHGYSSPDLVLTSSGGSGALSMTLIH